MDRIECSVWNNGGSAWGLRVLGGPSTRGRYFNESHKDVQVELGDCVFRFSTGRPSFWRKCPELIGKPLREWFAALDLKPGDRVWLEVVEPFRRFRVQVSQKPQGLKPLRFSTLNGTTEVMP
jgi:hypothetical protein